MFVVSRLQYHQQMHNLSVNSLQSVNLSYLFCMLSFRACLELFPSQEISFIFFVSLSVASSDTACALLDRVDDVFVR
jgi:hypothetical protein